MKNGAFEAPCSHGCGTTVTIARYRKNGVTLVLEEANGDDGTYIIDAEDLLATWFGGGDFKFHKCPNYKPKTNDAATEFQKIRDSL